MPESNGETTKQVFSRVRRVYRINFLPEEVSYSSDMEPGAQPSSASTNKAHIRRQHHDMKGDLRRVNLTHTLPGVTAASDTVCCSKGVMTATSMAACWPQHQLGKRMSAWRALQLGTTPGASFLCPRAAVWAARDK